LSRLFDLDFFLIRLKIFRPLLNAERMEFTTEEISMLYVKRSPPGWYTKLAQPATVDSDSSGGAADEESGLLSFRDVNSFQV